MLSLARLDRREGAALVGSVAGNKPLPDEIMQEHQRLITFRAGDSQSAGASGPGYLRRRCPPVRSAGISSRSRLPRGPLADRCADVGNGPTGKPSSARLLEAPADFAAENDGLLLSRGPLMDQPPQSVADDFAGRAVFAGRDFAFDKCDRFSRKAAARSAPSSAPGRTAKSSAQSEVGALWLQNEHRSRTVKLLVSFSVSLASRDKSRTGGTHPPWLRCRRKRQSTWRLFAFLAPPKGAGRGAPLGA
jgi:hypothetical protein